MKYDPFKHHRRSIRLKGYDYWQAGAYFVTLCTEDRQLFFDDPTVRQIAEDCWRTIPEHSPDVELGEWIVMPNHVHGIIVINAGRGVQLNAPTTNAPTQLNAPTIDVPVSRDPTKPFSMMSPKRRSLSVIIRTYKAAVTTRCREVGHADFSWQRNYYEHIIRNDQEWDAIAAYIANNPVKWSIDMDNPANSKRCSLPKSVDDYLDEVRR